MKCLLILPKFLGLIIKQKPTPQLNVLSISLSDIEFSFNHLKISEVLTLSKLISATKLSYEAYDTKTNLTIALGIGLIIGILYILISHGIQSQKISRKK